jgi:putative transposase
VPAKYEPPTGWIVQAYCFTLDPSAEQEAAMKRFFGARRMAYNWALDVILEELAHHRATGEKVPYPNMYRLRKRWNIEKSTLCVNRYTGEVWWPQVSKGAFADGIRGAVGAYWNWQKSRSGQISGRPVGFPKYKKRGKDRDRCTFTTGAMRVGADRRHLTLPVIGAVRTTKTLER